MEVFHQLCIDKCHENGWNVRYAFMRSCAWIGNSKLWITHVSIFLTILSMSECLGMCLQMIDKGVSIGTSAWGICVYVVRRRGRLAPRQPLSVCALLPAYEGNRHLRPLGNLGHRLRRPRWID